MILHIDAERPAPRKLQPVIDALKRDQVVIYPTDTGYAFGCAISSPKAIAVLRRLKGIDERHPKPLTMLVNDIADIGRYAHMGTSLYRLVKRLLPGPYTLVLKATSDTPRTMYNRHHEVGIRIPNHAVCRMLVELLGEPILKKMANELVRIIRSNVTIDWQTRDNVRAHLRRLVKRLLRKYKYPPDQQEKATETVLKQAELLAESFAA